jgi:formylglycine-generating enzyme required for sulfatase activity
MKNKSIKIIFTILLTLIISQTNIFSFENSIGINFKVIPPGDFMMGSPKSEPGHKSDEKLHKVIISRPFYISTKEITQGQWYRLMEYNPSSKTHICAGCPVESVSWNEAQKFIEKLNRREGTDSYRLPTEAEWEYACRAGTKTAFYTGPVTSTDCSHDKALDKAGWYCGNSGMKNPYYNLRHQQTGLKQPNKFGLYDMHGNVMEWCLDSTYWDNTFSRTANASMETYKDGVTDPLGRKGDKKILRGGSFVHSAEMARAAKRFFFGPKVKRNYIGLRLVKEIN